jgi:hypothetical protein
VICNLHGGMYSSMFDPERTKKNNRESYSRRLKVPEKNKKLNKRRRDYYAKNKTKILQQIADYRDRNRSEIQARQRAAYARKVSNAAKS